MNEVYLRKYRDRLLQMIAENSVEEFKNENRDCTQVIMQEFVRHAKEFVYIQCTKFFPVVDCYMKDLIACAISCGVDVKIAVRERTQENLTAQELNRLKPLTVLPETSLSDVDFIVTDGNRYLRQVSKGSEELKGSVNGKEEAEWLVAIFKGETMPLSVNEDFYRIGFWQFLKSEKVEIIGANKLEAKVFVQESVTHAKEFIWIQGAGFLRDKETQKYLVEALGRGVDVRINLRGELQEILEELKGVVRHDTPMLGVDFIVTDGDRCLIEVDKESEYSMGCFNSKDLVKHLKFCFLGAQEPERGEKYQWITIELKEPSLVHPAYHEWMSVCEGNVKVFARWATDAYNARIKEVLEELRERKGTQTLDCIFAHVFSDGKGNIFQYLSEPTNELPEKVREGERLFRIPILADEIQPMFLNVAASIYGEEVTSFVFTTLNRKAVRTIREGIKKYLGS